MTLFELEADVEAGRAVYSVSEVNRLARELIEGGFPGVIVEGEITGLNRHSSGHWYFTLKDSNAKLECAMFRGDNRTVRFRPANGDQVSARGNLSIYEAQGRFQLKVTALEKSGSGELRRAYEILKSRLQAEGLFDPGKKESVGAEFRHIGVITSRSGAALHDILSVFERRFPATRLTLFPVAVQGEQAPHQICQAIESANALRGKLGLEALIVCRGGGSP
ncbi:MAG: exodeoxyribonuclease VII large subunit, partial [Rhodospirillaceae bacterium]|nr:exodeoxyribonuclease VII large subunit [Rhodospirillaceae bacterium]